MSKVHTENLFQESKGWLKPLRLRGQVDKMLKFSRWEAMKSMLIEIYAKEFKVFGKFLSDPTE